MKKFILLAVVFNLFFTVYGQQNPIWTKMNSADTFAFEKLQRKSTPKTYQLYSLDLDMLKTILATAPARANNKTVAGVVIPFPTPQGTLENFRVYEASILHPDLAARYPDIQSYAGVSVENPSSSIRFSVTIFGLHTMSFSADEGNNYIDPYTNDRTKYIVYSKSELSTDERFECGVTETVDENTASRSVSSSMSNTGIFRQYRLALSSTIEYSTFHINQAGVSNGTVAQKRAAVLAGMVATMTRVNGLYERDLSITLEIIANNDVLISLNADDGFSNDNGVTLLGQNQAYVTNLIGSDNYDIGHIFSTGGGGIAAGGSVCSPNQKARGVTGSPFPTGDAFDIDYVAHEMGHQFGANHTFNGIGENCTTNTRVQATAVEPGSGTTIMGYAGICSPVNVQSNSDAHFSSISIAEIDALVASSANCSVNTPNINSEPIIAPLQSYIIPKSTPFVLKATATDADGDALTYCWEQINNEISTQPPSSTSTTGPNYRSRTPSTSPNRFLPLINNVIGNNITPTWEVTPSVARNMNFSLTVRDNNILNGGQTNRTDMSVAVANVGPFQVTSPNTNLSWQAGSNQQVTWNVAGTTANGINTPFVDIYLSVNGGLVFPTLLASAVPNDGAETITVPNTVGTNNRIVIMGHDNIFYDMSNANFAITAAPSTFAIAYNGVAGEQAKSSCIGTDVVYTLNYSALAGFTGSTTLTATGNPPGSVVTFSPNPISASGTVTMTVSNTASIVEGFYTIEVAATSGATTKLVNLYLQAAEVLFTPITLTSPTNSATNQPVDVNLTWTQDIFADPYEVQVATDAAFTDVVVTGNPTTNSFTASGLESLTTYFWRVRSKNSACSSDYSSVFQFTTKYCNGGVSSTNVPIVISAEVASVVNSTITIPANASVTINDIDVTLDITHSWIRDLNVKLISPTGTEIVLFTALCSIQTAGFEDANATFDDGAQFQVSCGPTNPRISGRVRPNQPLSGLNGQTSEGIWTLRVTDGVSEDGGSINSWSLNICSASAPLDIEEIESVFNFSVFPNPNNGSFTVKSDKVTSEKTKIQVVDMRGRIIFENEFDGSNTLNENIQLQNAQAGVYLLSVNDGENKEVKRIIIK